ncbi:guanine nucleotide exchange factor for Rab-3A-like [Dendronephthya gigantea]|uniref:guanine nucleotide exchange factor for Rab-3A-like n=1 Tax=Dendronephthya gigantea TaxID=151771 RepID=UPI00106D56FE|nr:guanine nucleotide exchange factor for Rab-3A-like [Dendronephthya gigantea]
MDGMPDKGIGHESPVENGFVLNRCSSEPELGIVVKSCAHIPTPVAVKVDSKTSLSSASSGEFRQRASTHGGATASMKKIAVLRKQRLAKSSSTYSTESHDLDYLSRRYSQDLMKAQAFDRLQEQLNRAQEELKLKDEEVLKLSSLRNELESELEELTASLFQEAHAMVLEANIKQSNAEKKFNETNSKVDMLEAEVEALKTLVITSTPSKPGFRRRSTEQLNSCDSCGSVHCMNMNNNFDVKSEGGNVANQEKEVDVIVFKEFLAWMEDRKFDRTQPFLSRMYNEDVGPCLDFTNKQLSTTFQDAIESNSLVLELLSTKGIRRKCALTGAMRICRYRVAASDTSEWHYISQSARHRLVAVCDFFTYIRYLYLGLVKKDVTDIYWEIMELRKQMAFAKCGLSHSQ